MIGFIFFVYQNSFLKGRNLNFKKINGVKLKSLVDPIVFNDLCDVCLQKPI